jgi:hypothetical protein
MFVLELVLLAPQEPLGAPDGEEEDQADDQDQEDAAAPVYKYKLLSKNFT